MHVYKSTMTHACGAADEKIKSQPLCWNLQTSLQRLFYVQRVLSSACKQGVVHPGSEHWLLLSWTRIDDWQGREEIVE